jgi:hypothetical protein
MFIFKFGGYIMKDLKRILASLLAGIVAFLAVFLNLLSAADKAS